MTIRNMLQALWVLLLQRRNTNPQHLAGSLCCNFHVEVRGDIG